MYLSKIPYPLRMIYPGNVIWNFNSNEPLIYLTFDDGPNPGTTEFILETLNNKSISATFFCRGGNIEKYPGLLQEMTNNGHSIGNHTFSHLKGTGTSLDEYLNDFQRSEQLFPTKIFRPPYGKMTYRQALEIGKTHKIIMWTILTGDFDMKRSPQKCLRTAENNLNNGCILVFHDSEKAAERMKYALPRFIDYALDKGFGFGKIE